jgi:hypothetical protein
MFRLRLEPTPARGRYYVPKDHCGRVSAVMTLFVGTKVRFLERYRPSQVLWRAVGTIVDMEERRAPNSGADYWVRARSLEFEPVSGVHGSRETPQRGRLGCVRRYRAWREG